MSQPDTPRAHTGPAGASRTDPTDPSSALVTDRADGRWAAHTSVDTESVVHHARACIAAAGQAAEVLRPLVGSDASARDDDALHACDDAVDVLRAVAALCARPPAASRAAVLRKTLEAYQAPQDHPLDVRFTVTGTNENKSGLFELNVGFTVGGGTLGG